MKRFLEKARITFWVIFVFMGMLGLSISCHQLFIGVSNFADWTATLGIIAIVAYFIQGTRHYNYAEGCLVGHFGMYMAVFLAPLFMALVYCLAVLMFVSLWISYERYYKEPSEDYSRWMVYNILLLGFTLGAQIVVMMKGMVEIPAIIGSTVGLWLMMIVRLSLRLKE